MAINLTPAWRGLAGTRYMERNGVVVELMLQVHTAATECLSQRGIARGRERPASIVSLVGAAGSL